MYIWHVSVLGTLLSEGVFLGCLWHLRYISVIFLDVEGGGGGIINLHKV